MKIVLFALNGSFSHSNLGLRCLRPHLEFVGYDVVLVEHTLRDRRAHILERLYREHADVYGFSCYIWNLGEMLSISRTLHELLPHSRIIFGGPEVSFATERFDGMDWIDAIVCGEGEYVLTELCGKMARGETFTRVQRGHTPPRLENAGILYRDGETCGGILYYESSRGCPYSCAYCLSSATHGVRLKSVEETLADMERFESLAVDCRIIKFVDRTFNADVKRANAIWRALLEPKYTKKYHFEVCATLLNEESFNILAQFPPGKMQLEFGLQSTHVPTLAATSRHIDPQRVIDSVRRIHEKGNIHVHLDLIAGLPYETYERFGKSFDDAYGCCDLLQLGFLKLLWGTELRARAEEYGYRCLPEPPYTVLQSNWITYDEMCRLTHIAEVLERYLESGRFTHTLWYLIPLMRSPFRFWEGLCVYLQKRDSRPLQRISQPDVFRYLLEYAEQSVDGAEHARLIEMLGADFSQHEHKNPPNFLRK